MKTKKLFGAAAITVAAAAVLASCNGNKGNDKAVVFLTTAGDNLKTVLDDAKAKFEKENDGWTVDIQTGYSYDSLKTKVTSDLTAGGQPSLAYCYGDHVASYLKTGKVLDFNTFINGADGLTEEDKTDLAAYYDEGTVFGDSSKRYTMPMSKSTDAVYYNKSVITDELLAKLDIDFSNPAKWTWAKMWTLCSELKKLYPNSIPLGYDSEANWVISYLEAAGALNNTKLYTDGTQSGKDKIVFNNDSTKAMFGECWDKFADGLFTTKGVSGSYTSSLFTQYKKTSTAADYKGSFISIGSTGGASHQMPEKDEFEVGLVRTPSIDGTEKSLKMISQGPSLVMFDQGSQERANMTWKFAKILLSTEVQTAYAKASGGYSPVRKSAIDAVLADLDLTTASGRVNKLCLDVMAQAKGNFYTSDCFDGSSTARTEIGNALITLLKAQAKPGADKASNINSAIKQALDETSYYTK
ncbi:MAG: hypothetical protein K6G28_03180 [Acholeplasmatales bacterium]|nr:hypothetical protein [Acholeplasmatales bacterium]